MPTTDPVAVHLKDLCHWESRIINPMLNLHRGIEFSKLVAKERRAGVSNVVSPDILLRSTEIIHEVIPEGGWRSAHGPAD